MEPEIARRCPGCGASVRGRAHFCPQCGRSTDDAPKINLPATDTQPRSRAGAVEESDHAAASLKERLSSPVDPTAATISASSGGAHEIETGNASTTPLVFSNDATPESARGKIRQRAADVSGSLRPRVEKVREASISVFDEASDDPGLRFVLIAVVLFVLFLLFLLISKILS